MQVFLRVSETALVEAGTEHHVWLVHTCLSFGERLYNSTQGSLVIECMFICSEQFHLDPGNESTSLMSNLPGIAGTGRGEPGTDGGMREAHP